MEENMEKKNNKTVGKTIIIVVLLVVFLGIGYLLGTNKTLDVFGGGKSDIKENGSSTNSDNTTNTSNDFTPVEVDNMIEHLFKSVSTNMAPLSSTENSLKSNEMSDEYKGIIAANNFIDKIVMTGSGAEVDEKDVEYAYNSIFGVGAYASGQKIYVSCGNWVYDPSQKKYTTTSYGCGGTSRQLYHEVVINAEKNSNQIKITTASAFVDGNDDTITSGGLSGTVESIIGSSNYDDIDPYIKSHPEKFEQYVYTFEKQDYNYIYVEVKRK